MMRIIDSPRDVTSATTIGRATSSNARWFTEVPLCTNDASRSTNDAPRGLTPGCSINIIGTMVSLIKLELLLYPLPTKTAEARAGYLCKSEMTNII